MASHADFAMYAADQLSEAGNISFRKCFGDYVIYCSGKVIGLICSDMLYIKMTEAGRQFAPHLDAAPPFQGAKPWFLIDDIDDREFLTKLAALTWDALPFPKPKKPRKRKNSSAEKK